MRFTKYSIILIAVVVVAIVLRLAAINVHSLWWDELQSMRTADPANSFSDIVRICNQSADPAPRTFYFVLNIWFRIFGYNDFSSRLFTAIFGIAAIPVMYFLGKQLKDKQAGLIAAFITAFNYYHIFYSLEVRFYSPLFFFSAASYLFFLKSLAQNSVRNLVLYVISTLLLMSFHYFGILIFLTQGLTFIVLFNKQIISDYKKYTRILLAFLLIALIYLPFISGLIKTLHTETAALSGNPGSYFFINYFITFFGFSGITVIPAAIAFLFFVIAAFLFGDNRVRFTTALILLTWIIFPLAAAYTRTLFGNPTMGERYFIIVLPGLFMALALGIHSIIQPALKYAFIAFYFFACIISLTGEHRFYSSTGKDDFKGVARFINAKEKQDSFYVLSDKNWHFKYYFDQCKLHPKYIDVINYADSRFYFMKEPYTVEKLVADSMLKKIWLISAHFANLQKMRELCNTLISSGHFALIDSFESKDAFARLIVRKDPNDKFFNYNIPLAPDKMIDLDNQKVLPIWDGEVILNPIPLTKGKYELSILSKGTAAAGAYAHLNVFMNGNKLGDYYSTPQFERKSFNFEVNDQNVVIKLQMDNDLYNPQNNEDRNVFISRVILNRQQ